MTNLPVPKQAPGTEIVPSASFNEHLQKYMKKSLSLSGLVGPTQNCLELGILLDLCIYIYNNALNCACTSEVLFVCTILSLHVVGRYLNMFVVCAKCIKLSL